MPISLYPPAPPAARDRASPFFLVVENVLDYVALRDRVNPSCKIVVSIIDQPKVRHEVDAFIRKWEQVVDRVIEFRRQLLSTVVSWTGMRAGALPIMYSSPEGHNESEG